MILDLLHPWIPVEAVDFESCAHEGQFVIGTIKDESGNIHVSAVRWDWAQYEGCERVVQWQDAYGAIVEVLAFIPFPDPYFPDFDQ